jgi:hypothetical protein
VWVSPRYRDTSFPLPLSLEHKIAIYEDAVLGWFLDIAKSLTKQTAADFVILMVILSFFEGHAIYLRGRVPNPRESGEFFKYGFKAVLGSGLVKFDPPHETKEEEDKRLHDAAEWVYKRARNGMFHDGMVRRGIELFRGDTTRKAPPFELSYDAYDNPARVRFNTPGMLDIVTIYFQEYIAKLRDPANKDLRERFETIWDELHSPPDSL